MKNYQFILGIDVSKKTLDLCLLSTASLAVKHTLHITNNAQGYQHMMHWLKKHCDDTAAGIIVLEHTGIYSLVLCMFLQKCKLNYCLIAGLELKRSIGIARGKQDQKDAFLLARYGYVHRHDIQPSALKEQVLLDLQMLQAQRKRLVNSRKALQVPVKEAYGMGLLEQARIMENNQRTVIEALRQQIKAIEKQMLALIQSSTTLKAQYDLCRSIPGVGMQLSICLLVTTAAFSRFSNSRALACYAGVAPFPYQSGTSIRGRSRVSPLADVELKTLLHMASLNAKRSDKQLRLYYERKRSEGKNAMSVLNAIRNKLLQRIIAVVKRQKPYVELAQYAA